MLTSHFSHGLDMWGGRSGVGIEPVRTVFVRGCGVEVAVVIVIIRSISRVNGSIDMGLGLTVGSFALLNGMLLEFLDYPSSL